MVKTFSGFGKGMWGIETHRLAERIQVNGKGSGGDMGVLFYHLEIFQNF